MSVRLSLPSASGSAPVIVRTQATSEVARAVTSPVFPAAVSFFAAALNSSIVQPGFGSATPAALNMSLL